MKPRDHAEKSSEQLPQRLKAARKRADLTQDDLVEIAEFSPVALSKLERGINRPSYENFVSLSYALGASPNYLTGWDEERTSVDGAEKRLLLNRLMLAADNLSEEWLLQMISIAEKANENSK